MCAMRTDIMPAKFTELERLWIESRKRCSRLSQLAAEETKQRQLVMTGHCEHMAGMPPHCTPRQTKFTSELATTLYPQSPPRIPVMNQRFHMGVSRQA